MKFYLYITVIFGIAPWVAFALTDAELDEFYSSTDVTNEGEVDIFVGRRVAILILQSNGIPDHDTSSVNQNEAVEQDYSQKFPRYPETVTSDDDVGCLPPVIGYAVNGVPFYTPSTSSGQDAVLTETYDVCGGHPDPKGRYHYHGMPHCVLAARGNSSLIGVAKDGFPIYGNVDAETGQELFSADLDICHGRTVNGKYQYHVTSDYPYILGCYRGDDLSYANQDSNNCEVYGGRTELKKNIIPENKDYLLERLLKDLLGEMDN